ncbi:hypothetical protein [Paenibacillus illinoisensis]|uniref:hypothetical protein n=1 Tax=Paenibacillus illinoisensis TaxID=59845 RepID=UPI00203EA78D|nr:hypothetical protein [Paenibacillus illinoisensis]MCM3202904.1 hypothetical protein [Paenibacillus illinoisensis]
MDRQADHSIKGFLYQFLLTIKLILDAPLDTEITCEGIEDIDISDEDTIEVIQCKYHEAIENFTLSSIYKPVLLMMRHFVQFPGMTTLNYRLYAFFPNEPLGIKALAKAQCEEILISKDKRFRTYIEQVQGVDLDAFLAKFQFQIGHKYEELVELINLALINEGFKPEEIDNIIFPNLIHYISELSIKKTVEERKVTKRYILQKLRHQRKLLVSKWVEEYSGFNKLIKNKKELLHEPLNSRLRRRAFIFNKFLSEKTEHIVTFIKEILQKYYASDLSRYEPIVCLNLSDDDFNRIRKLLYHQGIIAWDGYVADEFIPARFINSPPVVTIGKKIIKPDYHLKIINRNNIGVLQALNNIDDYYVLDSDITEVVIPEARKEVLNFTSFNYLNYIFQLRRGYEHE